MKTKTLKIAFAGIAVVMIAFTLFFASTDTIAQNDSDSNIEASYDVDSENSIEVSEYLDENGNLAECSSNCEGNESCMTECTNTHKKECQGSSNCKK